MAGNVFLNVVGNYFAPAPLTADEQDLDAVNNKAVTIVNEELSIDPIKVQKEQITKALATALRLNNNIEITTSRGRNTNPRTKVKYVGPEERDQMAQEYLEKFIDLLLSNPVDNLLIITENSVTPSADSCETGGNYPTKLKLPDDVTITFTVCPARLKKALVEWKKDAQALRDDPNAEGIQLKHDIYKSFELAFAASQPSVITQSRDFHNPQNWRLSASALMGTRLGEASPSFDAGGELQLGFGSFYGRNNQVRFGWGGDFSALSLAPESDTERTMRYGMGLRLFLDLAKKDPNHSIVQGEFAARTGIALGDVPGDRGVVPTLGMEIGMGFFGGSSHIGFRPDILLTREGVEVQFMATLGLSLFQYILATKSRRNLPGRFKLFLDKNRGPGANVKRGGA